jgi:hypothetical protein
VRKTRGGTTVNRGWEGVRGEGVGHTQRRKRSVAAMISNQQQFRAAMGIPRGGSSKPRGSASIQNVSVEGSGERTGGCQT